MDQQSIVGKIGKSINAVMVKIFGVSWRTSFNASIAFLLEAANFIQTYLAELGLSPAALHGVALIFGLMALLHAKDGKVTGGTIASETGAKNNGR